MGKQLASPFRHIPLIRFSGIGTYYGTIISRTKTKKKGLLKINTSHAVGKIYRPSARILEPRFACKCGLSRNIHAKPSPRSRKRSIIYLFLEHAGSDAVRFMGKPPVPNLGFLPRRRKQQTTGHGACFACLSTSSRDSARLASPFEHAERRCAPLRSHCDFW